MPHALLDRPVPAAAAPRRRRRVLPLVVGGALLAGAAVAGPALVDRLTPALPFSEQTVDRSTPVLLTSLADLRGYHAATGSFQVVVDLERDVRFVPSAVSGERTSYLATGSVDAVVDFTGLDGSAVETTPDGRSVVFHLRPARLDEAEVDLANSRVLARDRGVLDRVAGVVQDSPTSEREVAALAERRLGEAAEDSDLLRRAETNTEAMLTGLARSLGYTDVQVRYDAADPA